MSDKTYRKLEVVGCSSESIEKAVETAVFAASKEIKGISWFEVNETRGAVRDGKPVEWQVTITVGGKLG
jgi:dodecin